MFGGSTSGSFLGLPAASVGDTDPADIVLMSCKGATPYPSVGPYCQNAATAIRSAFGWPGILEHHDFDAEGKLLDDGVRAIDWGELTYHQTDFEQNRRLIKNAVQSALKADAVPIVIGGDDSVPIPVLQAYEKHGPVTVVQVDAHIDWRQDVDGETMGLSSNMRRASEMPWIKNIIQIGARGIGSARPQDYQDALDWGVQFFPMKSIAQNGLSPVIQAVPKDVPVFITIDIDGMDPSLVPGVIGPAPGGLDYWQMVTLLEGIAQKNPIIGADLVEFMPEGDIGGRGALVAARLIALTMSLISRQRAKRT